MNCSGRALPWSILIQGLTRTRPLDHPINLSGSVRLAPGVLRTAVQGRVSPASLQRHGFHGSRDSYQQTAQSTKTATEKTRTAIPPGSEEGDRTLVLNEPSSTPPGSQLRSPVAAVPKNSLPDADSASNAVSVLEDVLRRKTTKAPQPDENKPWPKTGPRTGEPTHSRKRRQIQATNADDDKPPRTCASQRHALRTKPRVKAPTFKPDKGYASKAEPKDSKRPKMEPWQVQKRALKEKFPDGWNPRKRLSPDALAGIRALNAQFPDTFTTEALAQKFKVTPEAIRRILRSRWEPTPEQEVKRQDRWFRRGQSVWERRAALGIKPPRKWRREGIVRSPEHHERSRQASLREKEMEAEEIRKYQEHRARMQKGLPPPREW